MYIAKIINLLKCDIDFNLLIKTIIFFSGEISRYKCRAQFFYLYILISKNVYMKTMELRRIQSEMSYWSLASLTTDTFF